MATCPECGKSVRPEWDECPYCEAVLPRFCPECGKEVDPEMRKCPYCKTRIVFSCRENKNLGRIGSGGARVAGSDSQAVVVQGANR